jgi:hypothetical protein
VIAVPAREVRPGDVVVFLSRPHLIMSVDERNAFGDPIARTDDGWGIALMDGVSLDVQRAVVPS